MYSNPLEIFIMMKKLWLLISEPKEQLYFADEEIKA